MASAKSLCPCCHPDSGKLIGHDGRCTARSAEETRRRNNKVCARFVFFSRIFFVRLFVVAFVCGFATYFYLRLRLCLWFYALFVCVFAFIVLLFTDCFLF